MKKITHEKIIQQFIKIHGNKYDYSKVEFLNTKTKICIICKTHGGFFQIPEKHKTGQGCPRCRYITIANSLKLNIEKIIQQFVIIHNNKYDYSLFKNYINNQQKIKIICRLHGIFEQTVHAHKNGKKGCFNCKNQNISNCLKFLNTEIINEFIKVHGNKFDYSLMDYVNIHTKIKIICKTHGVFKQTPNSHKIGYGCPQCSSTISKPEFEWLNSLKIPLENRQQTLKINNKIFKVDAYNAVTNTIYEFYGDYYHGNPKIYDLKNINTKIKKSFYELYNNTLLKEKYLRNSGYNLITIWENDWNNLINC